MSLNLCITLTYSEQFIRTAQSEQMNYNFNLNNSIFSEQDIPDNHSGLLPLKNIDPSTYNYTREDTIAHPPRFDPRFLLYYAPLEKGGILFCNCRSVGRYVGL